MTITQNKVVSVSYELRLDGFEGDVVEVANQERPLEFLFGQGMMLPMFESNLQDKKSGDTFKFKIECDDAYGQAEEEAIIDLPRQYVPDDSEIIYVGNVIPLQDEAGNRFNGRILEITDESIKIDLNHPLAGEDLFFTGEVLTIREATQEEINHSHGGCSCSCDDGCECGCEDGEECDCDEDESDYEDEGNNNSQCGCGCK